MIAMARAGVEPAMFGRLIGALKGALSERKHRKLMSALGMEAA